MFGRRQSEPEEKSEITPPSLPQPIGFETVMGATTSLDGTFSSKGNVRLDGEFSGTLDIHGNVLIGETAKINADVEARNISIAGAVRGNVTGNKVQLLRTGRVWGDINANALTIEEGAFIDGKITMQKEAEKAEEPSAEVVADTDEDEPEVAVIEDIDQDDEETDE